VELSANEIDISSFGFSEAPTYAVLSVTAYINTAFESNAGKCSCIEVPLIVESATTTEVVASADVEMGVFPLVNTEDVLKFTINDTVIDVTVNSASSEGLVLLGEITDFAYEKNFDVGSQAINPEGLFFKPDGTKMYAICSTGDDVNQYTLSTAWDVGTAVYEKVFSVGGTPSEIFFKSDGTKMYVTCTQADRVKQYNLPTPWDVATATQVGDVDVDLQEPYPTGLFFKPDGTKMYITGFYSTAVNQYSLSASWDVETAVYEKLFDVGSQESDPEGLFFKPDGTKMYIIGIGSKTVNQYALSIPWDAGTAVYEKLFGIGDHEDEPQGLFFKPDGTKMYVIGTTGKDVDQYTLPADTTLWDTAMFCNYTLTIPEQTHAPTAVTVPDRSTAESLASSVWGDDGKIVQTYDQVYKVGRALQYKLQASTGLEVHKVKYDLERA